MKGSNVSRAVILAVSCLILGFVGGWTLANIGSDTVSLPDVNLDTTVGGGTSASTGTDVAQGTTGTSTGSSTGTTVSTTSTGTTTGTTTTGTTGTSTTAGPVVRSDVTVAVLNGSGVNGKAAQVATSLRGKGWTDVATGNTATASGDTVYYRDASKDAADALGTDLQISTVAPLSQSSIASSVNASADVVVVLGS